MKKLDERLIQARPSKRQLNYLNMGFLCFIHYSMNTYTDTEWGNGNENPALFRPADVDTNEWVLAAKSAGMKGIILTCKHHDGFCLWPSKYTEHSIKNSPYNNGQGDLVRELSESCIKHGVKFGVYLSPWDRNSKYYGSGKAYDDYYVNQLTELLTEYGDIFAVWLDGACGENEQGNKQIYDWKRYFDVVRKLQPEAVISICGPDIRWCGNEAGMARKSEWSVVSAGMCDPEQTAQLSQKEDDISFRERPIDPTMEDLGSREVLQSEEKLIYYPSEMDVSIRPGWFYHANEDARVKSAEELFDIYLKSVGHNSTLLLNVPVMPNGHMNAVDLCTLKELGEIMQRAFSDNLYKGAKMSSFRDGKILLIRIQWEEKKELHYLILQEQVEFSQRIEKYDIYGLNDSGEKEKIYEGTTIGFKEIVPLNGYRTDCVVIEISDSRVSPLIANIEVY